MLMCDGHVRFVSETSMNRHGVPWVLCWWRSRGRVLMESPADLVLSCQFRMGVGEMNDMVRRFGMHALCGAWSVCLCVGCGREPDGVVVDPNVGQAVEIFLQRSPSRRRMRRDSRVLRVLTHSFTRKQDRSKRSLSSIASGHSGLQIGAPVGSPRPRLEKSRPRTTQS